MNVEDVIEAKEFIDGVLAEWQRKPVPEEDVQAMQSLSATLCEVINCLRANKDRRAYNLLNAAKSVAEWMIITDWDTEKLVRSIVGAL